MEMEMEMEMERSKGTTTEAMSPASVAGDGVTTNNKRARSEEEEVAGDGSTTTTNRPTDNDVEAAQAEAAAGSSEAGSGKTKRTKLIKFPKDVAEFVLRRGRPNLPRPVRRPTATQLDIAPNAQKQIDRYDQIWEQYMEKGEAEIEITDDEEDDAAAEVVDLDKRFPPRTLFPLGDKLVTVEELLVFMGVPA